MTTKRSLCSKCVHSARDEAKRPIANAIGEWSSNTAIYQCPTCGQSFRFHGKQCNYCFGCGQKLDWAGVITEVSFAQVKTYHENNGKRAQEVLDWINTQNKGSADNDKN